MMPAASRGSRAGAACHHLGAARQRGCEWPPFGSRVLRGWLQDWPGNNAGQLCRRSPGYRSDGPACDEMEGRFPRLVLRCTGRDELGACCGCRAGYLFRSGWHWGGGGGTSGVVWSRTVPPRPPADRRGRYRLLVGEGESLTAMCGLLDLVKQGDRVVLGGDGVADGEVCAELVCAGALARLDHRGR